MVAMVVVWIGRDLSCQFWKSQIPTIPLAMKQCLALPDVTINDIIRVFVVPEGVDFTAPDVGGEADVEVHLGECSSIDSVRASVGRILYLVLRSSVRNLQRLF
jgi:hypothetical protein